MQVKLLWKELRISLEILKVPLDVMSIMLNNQKHRQAIFAFLVL